MKKEEFEKKRYVSPSIEVIKTEADCPLLIGSKMNGGHTKADDDGNDISDAKRGYYEDFEDEEETPQPWGLQ